MPIVARNHDILEPEVQVPSWTALEDTVTTCISAALSDPARWATDPQVLRDAIDQGIRQGLAAALQAAADRWAEELLGAGRYERTASRTGLRSGSRLHRVAFPFGQVDVEVTKPRSGKSRPDWLAALKLRPAALVGFARRLWLRGLSTRDIDAVSKELAGKRFSHTTIANWVKDVADDVIRWSNRPIPKGIRYLVLDALHVPVTREKTRKEPILVALGITEDGIKEVLDIMAAPSESTESWATIAHRLKARGLDTKDLALVITDGNDGVISAVNQHLSDVIRQRCTVHKVRNVVGRCPKDLKGVAPAEAALIYKAPSRVEAQRRAGAFIEKYEQSQPKIAAIVRDDLDACLAFYDFDPGKWQGLRSTNALERINRELRRKFREIGAMKAEFQVNRIAVQVAAFLNEDMKEKPIDGFGRPRRRGSRKSKSAPTI